MAADGSPAGFPGAQVSAHPEFFRFESDFVDSLRCIPMSVRLRLDVSGVKLKLNEWSKLGRADRLALALHPCRSADEIAAYRGTVSAIVARACGAPPSPLRELPEPVWENGSEVPRQVSGQARAAGKDIAPSAWAGLSPLRRFALLKLSRPGHENLNFLPALEEFGLA
jgi:hypothetical protein